MRMDKALPKINPLQRAPRSHACVVFINPAYKVIYVKLPKTGGSSIVDTMGGRCKGRPPAQPDVQNSCLLLTQRMRGSNSNSSSWQQRLFAASTGVCVLCHEAFLTCQPCASDT